MSHWAELDGNNIVLRVTVMDNAMTDEDALAWLEANLRGRWIRTSYNNTIRKQFAGIGFSYDPVRDEFVKPRPFPSWNLDANNDWQAPYPMPSGDLIYRWNEDAIEWVGALV